MKSFAALFATLDQTTRTSVKVAAMADYFRTAPEPDKLWTVALFSGRRPKRVITAGTLRDWAAQQAGISPWLFDESYAVAGDLAETIALILPPATAPRDHSLSHWIGHLKTLSALPEDARKSGILAAWDALDGDQRFLFTKLLTGGFRVGVSQTLMTRALAQALDLAEPDVTHRLMGNWTPETTTWGALFAGENPSADLSRPYPFCLAHALPDAAAIGPVTDWFADFKWDGIRAQLILRGGDLHLWSRGEDLITARFPDLAPLRHHLPDGTVIDGELLAWSGTGPLPFGTLQKRLGRKTVPKTLLRDAPVVLMAYDLLEWGGTDIRGLPFNTRRAELTTLTAALPPNLPLHLSAEQVGADWGDLATIRGTARDQGAEGLMLKRRSSPYHAGRKTGDWWKWKTDPLTIDAVMIYAQAGHGRRATLFTDYTFAVWDGDTLTPFTKAYSGLTDAEFGQITAWVRKNTQQKFGPVRQVTPGLVFEIAFEGIGASPRHKSGVALRFPRMLRWRQDKPAAQANTLDDLREMLRLYGG